MLITVGKIKDNHWVLKDSCIEIFHSKPRFFKKSHLYQSIPFNNIYGIRIYWKNVLMGHIWKYAHPLYMDVLTFDKTTFSVELNTDNNRINLVQAINVLKQINIKLIDEYDIISALENPTQNIWEYIENVIKKNNLGYK